jgi:hypothetical protein
MTAGPIGLGPTQTPIYLITRPWPDCRPASALTTIISAAAPSPFYINPRVFVCAAASSISLVAAEASHHPACLTHRQRLVRSAHGPVPPLTHDPLRPQPAHRGSPTARVPQPSRRKTISRRMCPNHFRPPRVKRRSTMMRTTTPSSAGYTARNVKDGTMGCASCQPATRRELQCPSQ